MRNRQYRLLLCKARVLCVNLPRKTRGPSITGVVHYSSTISVAGDVRVRFAPSPTGFMHLGGLRTALYNYLFAKRYNGKFILRIEDTDQGRFVPESVDHIESMLDWAGIFPDESPKKGGEHGPYIQSLRKDVYRDHAHTLLENGSAYRCFCSDYRLNMIRRDAYRNRQVPKYDNRCRHLSEREIRLKLEQEMPFTVRLKVPGEASYFSDIIAGDKIKTYTEEQGDFIIMKSDGFPTYHLASVVDDHLMKISHVLRGYEWVISTGKHLRLYSAFGWETPQFGHLPILLNKDGGKLSKRDGASISIQHFKDRGYLPDALLNFITLFGGGFAYRTSRDVLSREQMIQEFSLEKVSASASRLTMEHLDACNRVMLMRKLEDEGERKEMVETLFGQVMETYSTRLGDHIDRRYVEKVLRWASGRIHTISDLTSKLFEYIWLRPEKTPTLTLIGKAKAKLSCQSAQSALYKFIQLLENIDDEDFTQKSLSQSIQMLCNQDRVNYLILLRPAITGKKVGPPVAEMLEVLGKGESVRRLKWIQRFVRQKEMSEDAKVVARTQAIGE